MQKLKCQKCGWEWIPRTENPARCPRCQKHDWEEKKEAEK